MKAFFRLLVWITGFMFLIALLSLLSWPAFTIAVIAIWYFSKKDPNKRNRNIAVVVAVFSFFGILLSVGGGEEPEVAVEPETKEVEVVEEEEEPEEVEEPEEIEEVAEEDSEEENQSDINLDEINAEIAKYMEERRGFALGTLDSNGEPTENGEPNPDFSYALFIHELTYDGDNLEMQTDAGFMTLTDEERNLVARRAQSIAGNVIGPHEDWDHTNYQRGLFLTILNGDNALGHSRVLDVTEFKWYD